MTEPLSIRAIQTLPPMEVSVRPDDPEGDVDRADPVEKPSNFLGYY